MRTDSEVPSDRFALLASGASFSCQVLLALQQKRYLPSLVAIPEFPPAKKADKTDRGLLSVPPRRQFLELMQDVAIVYAPETQQTNCARLIQQESIDFILIACWPYLIDSSLINSVNKATLNLHPSLLPNYRGANPLERQIANHESRFGVSLHLLNNRFDRGDIVAQAEFKPAADLDRKDLEQHCAVLGAELFIAAIRDYDQGWNPISQQG